MRSERNNYFYHRPSNNSPKGYYFLRNIRNKPRNGDISQKLVQFRPKWPKLDIFLTIPAHEMQFQIAFHDVISTRNHGFSSKYHKNSPFWAIFMENEDILASNIINYAHLGIIYHEIDDAVS